MMEQLPRITDVGQLRGKRVLVRASLNVPVKEGVIQNTFRLRRALPTLQFLRDAGARTIVVGHIGREPHETLEPVCRELTGSIPIVWGGSLGTTSATADALADGELIMLENLRSNEGEETNDAAFTTQLASLADIYVNDAFSASHRTHASIVGVPKLLPHYAGVTFAEEYMQLQKVLQPQSPSVFILGGAKFETKLPLVKQYIERYDHVLISGALANDVWKARGYKIGRSKVSDIDLTSAPFVNDSRVILPPDVTVQDEVGRARITTPDDVRGSEIIYDAGPATVALISKWMPTAKTVLWNGPLGYFEGGFDESTKQCAELVAQGPAFSVVGGGDTIAAIEMLSTHEKFGFVSTAGGAMLVFLEKGTLPGIEALKEAS